MPTAPPATLDEQLCFALYGASMAVGRTYKPILDELGLTYPQYLVLGALADGLERTVGGVADRLALDPSTVTPLAKRLSAAGLITRARNRDNERQVLLALTPAGLDALDRSRRLGERLVAASGWTLAEIERLRTEVCAFRDALRAGTPTVERTSAGGRHSSREAT